MPPRGGKPAAPDRPARGLQDVPGFEFGTFLDRTGAILCGDLDGSGAADVILVGNLGNRDRLYRG